MSFLNKPIDFAVIGHQDSWNTIGDFVNGLRSDDLEPLSIENIKNTFGFITPKSIFNMRVTSKTGKVIHGAYIETFIDPDKLTINHLRSNIGKVNAAIKAAINLGAKIITLGGFTSIVMEGNLNSFNSTNSSITTGNTLTTAYIIKGIEKACQTLNLKLENSNVLIIGATGDIGMACTKVLSGKVKQLLLCARNKRRLQKFTEEIKFSFDSVLCSTDLNDLLHKADIIISAASSHNIAINNCKKSVLICDAGYPKNLDQKIENISGIKLFHGGMGQLNNGYDFFPDYRDHFYKYPSKDTAHGCILEAVVLALENKYENYSIGKGNITIEKIEEIYEMGKTHGIDIAPFYNSRGLWA